MLQVLINQRAALRVATQCRLGDFSLIFLRKTRVATPAIELTSEHLENTELEYGKVMQSLKVRRSEH